MRATIAVLVILGLIAAVSASVLIAAWHANGGTVAMPEPVEREVELVVAAMDLPASTIVDGSSIMIRRMMESDAPAGYVTREEALGRVLIAPMVEGQVFKDEIFAKDSSGFRLAAVLPSGKRAMSIALSESSALEGMLYPGSHVDVIASFTAEDPEEEGNRITEMLSTVLLEDVQVLAVQDRTIVSDRDETSGQQSSSRRRMVTLMVDSKQAEALQLAAAHGQISLALRNPLDDAGGTLRGTLFSDLARVYADRFNLLIDDEADVAYAMRASFSEPVARTVDVPAADVPAAAPAVLDAPVAVQVPPKPVWTTIVTRGMAQEQLEFEIDDEPTNSAPTGRLSPATAIAEEEVVERRRESETD